MGRLLPLLIAVNGVDDGDGKPGLTVTIEVTPELIGDPIFASSPADWDCARLAAERDDLFPPTPEVDW